jgi:hypothetical protein
MTIMESSLRHRTPELKDHPAPACYPRGNTDRRAVESRPLRLAIAWPQQSRSQATAALVRAATAFSES